MKSIPIWTEEVRVTGFESDFNGRWKPASFFRHLTTAAANHSANLGHSFEDMHDDGMTWVLSRLKIVFQRFPMVGERVIIQTWPKSVYRKLFFMRDFILTAPDGGQLALATSAWVLIDPESRRMLPASALGDDLPQSPTRVALDEIPDRILPPENLQERLAIEARYSHIDLVGHVNNGYYVDWVTDCFDFEDYRGGRLAWLQVNYSSEIRPGDRVSVGAGQPDGDATRWVVCGQNLTTGASAFEAALGWREEN